MWIAIAKTLNDCFATASRDMFLSHFAPVNFRQLPKKKVPCVCTELFS